MSLELQENKRFWFPLDNAAKIFPSVLSEEIPVVFRISAVLKEPVKINELQKALLLTEKRFPYYKVSLKKGFFWFYMEYLPKPIPIEVDSRVCRKFSENKILVRVLVKGKSISVEFSHILTDGGGAMEFFKTLIIEYSKMLGAEVPENFEYIKPDSEISEEEYEDAYNAYFKEEIPPILKRSKAFHLPFALNQKPRFRHMSAMISIEQIKAVAKQKNVNITIYLVAIYIYVLQEIFEELPFTSKFKRNKVIRLQVPVNLRGILPSKTMRNFSLFVMPEIDMRLGHYTFEEILKTVYHQISLETDAKLLNKNINRNVRSEKKFYIRAIPLFIKNAVLRMKYYSLGTKQYSGVISNIGLVKLPKDTSDLIDYFYVVNPPPNKMLKINCGIISFEDKLVMTFGSVVKSKEFEEKFRQFLEKEGVDMTIINS